MKNMIQSYCQYRRSVLCLLLLCILFLAGCKQDTASASASKETPDSLESVSDASPVALSAKVDPAVTSGTASVSSNNSNNSNSEIIHLGFAGDFNLDESWATTQYLDQQPGGIYDCMSPNLVALCNSFDVFMLNNEYTYSTRGSALPGKTYAFRANPTRVQTIQALGTDLVLLANNHVYDYGEDAFLDTLSTLDAAKISHVGAGRNIKEACEPVYYTFGNTTLAYVAATRAEKNLFTPEATDSSSGVLRAYDSANYLSVIKKASETSDYVIASIHWGTEYSTNAEPYQQKLAYALLDAGADAVIGSHTHVLQGIEYYKGKPIIYSLGNFWFNEKDLYSCVIDLGINTETGTLSSLRFIPCIQKNCTTTWPEDAAVCRNIFDFEQGISFGVTIDDSGYVVPDCTN